MTDRYQKIRDALAMGPTSGPWIVTHELREGDEAVCDLVNGTWIVTAPGVKLAHWEYDAAHIAACDPDTVRELLEEHDALRERVGQLEYSNAVNADAKAQAAKHAEKVDRLRERVKELEADAARYRWGINNARWIRGEQEAYVAIPVAPDADLSCIATRDAAIDQARGKGGRGEEVEGG